MLNRLPRHMPSLETLLDDLGRPKAKEIAKALHVSERSVQRWIKNDYAPRPVMLALFYVTRWGHNWVHTEAHNTALLHSQTAMVLRHENRDLKEKLKRMGQIGEFGAANDPADGVALPAASSFVPDSGGAQTKTFEARAVKKRSSPSKPTSGETKENQGLPADEPVQPVEPAEFKEASQ